MEPIIARMIRTNAASDSGTEYPAPHTQLGRRSDIAWQDDKHTTGQPTKSVLYSYWPTVKRRQRRGGHTARPSRSYNIKISCTLLQRSTVPVRNKLGSGCTRLQKQVRHGALGCGRRKAAPGPPAGRPASVSRPRGRVAIPTATEFPAAWPAPASPDGSKGRLERFPHVDRPRAAAIADAGHSQSDAAKTRDSRVIRTAFRGVDPTRPHPHPVACALWPGRG